MDDDVRNDWALLKSAHTTSRLLTDRRITGPLFRRDADVLSFDIFGYALIQAALGDDDIHRLVGSYLGRGHADLGPPYLDLRLEAEESARHLARSEGRAEISVPDIAEQLAARAGERWGRAEGVEIARSAIRCELDLVQLTNRANPEAIEVYQEALARGIDVAFIADSFLPRDLISRMLRKAGFRSDLVVISSQEGVTKSSGGLYATLVDRTGVDPDRITHAGPDPILDVLRPAALGLNTCAVTCRRTEARPQIELGMREHSALDSMGFALAADRLARAEDDIKPSDIGYYASGPMLAGFTSWIGRLIDEDRPDHVLFCGPTGGLLRHVLSTLRPDLPIYRLHHCESEFGQWPSPGELERICSSVEPIDNHRVLAVDLGWRCRPHDYLPELFAQIGRSPEVTGAYLGVPGDRPDEREAKVWAFAGSDDQPQARVGAAGTGVLEALIPPVITRRGRRAHDVGYEAELPQMAAGIYRYANDFHNWLRLDRHLTTSALFEPALRVISAPMLAEAQLLGNYIPDTLGILDPREPTPLAVLPPRSATARDPQLIERMAERALWPEGFRALTKGDPRIARSARANRRMSLRHLRPRTANGSEPGRRSGPRDSQAS